MNLAIRGIDYNLGREPADTLTRNQHPDLRADFILANPPFNISDWWHGSLEGDPRWHFGDPPQGNANYAWLQHMLHHLKDTGRAGIVLANGSMSSSQNNEGVIRAAMVDADVVEVMVALPGQLFFNTQIPACLWFLAKQKKRKGEVLFIDARKQAKMISRVQCELDDETIARIAETVAAWRGEVLAGSTVTEYTDQPGFCRSVPLAEIAQHGHVLTPGRYVGAEAVEDDDEAFDDKMRKLTEKLGEQMAKGGELDALIRAKLGGWGMSSEWPIVKLGTLDFTRFNRHLLGSKLKRRKSHEESQVSSRLGRCSGGAGVAAGRGAGRRLECSPMFRGHAVQTVRTQPWQLREMGQNKVRTECRHPCRQNRCCCVWVLVGLGGVRLHRVPVPGVARQPVRDGGREPAQSRTRLHLRHRHCHHPCLRGHPAVAARSR